NPGARHRFETTSATDGGDVGLAAQGVSGGGRGIFGVRSWGENPSHGRVRLIGSVGGNMKNLRHLIFGLAVASTFGLSSRAFAGIEACGDIDVEAEASCTVEVEGGCQVQCEPANFNAACSAELRVDCEGECNADFEAECSSSCEVDCMADCEIEPGTFDCQEIGRAHV